MIDCAAMCDRMPDVAHRASEWTEAEAAHLATCGGCALEWRVVQAGAQFRVGTTVAADRIARLVTARLREAPAEVSVIRRLPWRGAMIGLLTAAASMVLILGVPRLRQPGAVGTIDTAEFAIAPELQGLDDGQLETVLKALDPGPAELAAPGPVPHLEDLSDAQLEQLLHVMGGG